MKHLADLVRVLASKGLTAADVADVLEAMSGPVPAYGMEAATLNADLLKEDRRRRDTERKRAKRAAARSEIPAEIPAEMSALSAECPRTNADTPRETSADTADTSADSADKSPLPLPLPPSPQTPQPPAPTPTPATETRVCTHEGDTPQVGKPRKARKGEKLTIVPEGWAPNERHVARVAELGLTRDEANVELAKFREWEFRDPKTNFDLAFHRWLRTAAERKGAGHGRGSPDLVDRNLGRWTATIRPMAEGAAQALDRRRGRGGGD